MKRTVTGMALAMTLIASGGAFAQEAKADTSVTVFKTPWCGCCQVWADRMIEAGYTVETREMEDLTLIKRQGGVTDDMAACHTSVIGTDRKYVLEGHVPAEAIERLMHERPDIAGIAVPGMPQGSLGMGFDPGARYTVHAFTRDGVAPTAFMQMGE